MLAPDGKMRMRDALDTLGTKAITSENNIGIKYIS